MTERQAPYVAGPAADCSELAARLEAVQQRLREEQAALPKPLTPLHGRVWRRLDAAIDELETARRALGASPANAGGWYGII